MHWIFTGIEEKTEENIESENRKTERANSPVDVNNGCSIKSIPKSSRQKRKDTISIWEPLDYCHHKCHLKLTDNEQKLIFNSYSKECSDFISKFHFLSELIKLVPTYKNPSDDSEEEYSPRFYFKTTGSYQRVCEGCFQHILGEDSSFIKAVLQNKILNIIRKYKPCTALIITVNIKFMYFLESKEEKLQKQNNRIPETSTRIDLPVNTKVRFWTRIPKCPRECYLKITENDQECIFVSYWDDSTFKSRYKFLNDMIHISYVQDHSKDTLSNEKKKLNVDFLLDTMNGRVRVCKLCFQTVLAEERKMIKRVLDNKLLDIYGK